MFLILLYILAAQLIIYLLDIQEMLLGIDYSVHPTAATIGIFYIGYTQAPLDKSSFFSRWFHSAGASAVVYDMVMFLSFVYRNSFTFNRTYLCRKSRKRCL